MTYLPCWPRQEELSIIIPLNGFYLTCGKVDSASPMEMTRSQVELSFPLPTGITQRYLLTCTCVGIHPGRVEPASPIDLITSRTEALQTRQSCASSLETFTQSFLHRAWPKTGGPEKGSGSVLIVFAHVFSWQKKVLHKLTFGMSCSMAKPAEPSLHEQC